MKKATAEENIYMADQIVVPGQTLPSESYSLINLVVDLLTGKVIAGTKNVTQGKMSYERQNHTNLQVVISAQDLATIKTIFLNAAAQQINGVTIQ